MPVARILLVEDDPGIRQGVAEFLNFEGYGVDVASNGQEALAYLRQTRPGLVVLDLVMPVMNGPQLLRKMRSEGLEGIPVAIITAAMPGASSLPPADAYLTKPFDLDELLLVVRRHVGPASGVPRP
jgi:DNA-binding response OmpR family regulator